MQLGAGANAVTAMGAVIAATYRHLDRPARLARRGASGRSCRPARAATAPLAWVGDRAADLHRRGLLQPPHQCRHHHRRPLHGARPGRRSTSPRRRRWRWSISSISRCAPAARSASRNITPRRPRAARSLRPRHAALDVLAVAGDGRAAARRSASRCSLLFGPNFGDGYPLLFILSIGLIWSAPRSGRPRAC